MRVIRVLLFAIVATAAASTPALADVTVFVGSTPTPSNRPVKGVALSVDLLVLGLEFEYAETSESVENGAPFLRTGMGNLLLQTPPLSGIQLYVTAGGGLYRERLGARHETHVGANTGGGAKISLIGPVEARLDYRVFKLSGEPLHSVVQRVYAGLNLDF